MMVILQTVIPSMLLVPGIQGLRTIIRGLSYLVGWTGLAIPSAMNLRATRSHPSTPWAMLIAIYLAGTLIFSMSRIAPAVAEYVLILSVLAPVLWSPGLVLHPMQLHRILWLILATAGLNSLVGVLQVYDPDRWMPAEFSRQIADMGLYRYTGADGRVIIRPCGLYDSPGAVSAPGAWAAIVGFALFQQERAHWRKAIAIGAAFLGVAVIYLTLVRTAMVVVLVGAATYAVLLTLRKRSQDAVAFGTVVVTTLFLAMAFAAIFGGDAVIDRFQTLYQSAPMPLYYQSRGVQLEYAVFHAAAEYPFGIGLGSWGMAASHFGGGTAFAELQMHGWILDGGIPLLVMYSIAVCIAMWHDIQFCLTTHSLRSFRSASCIAAMNASTLVTIFSFVPFNTVVGMQFWLMTGMLRGVALLERRNRV